jgi:hypothetical protein
MMRTLPLRQEPSVRQIEALLATIERDLSQVGAKVKREGKGGLSFRMPFPWRAPHLGLMLAITSGRAVVSAGQGGPWRVRYDLNFLNLRLVAFIATIGIVVFGLSRSRVLMLNELIALWGLGYATLYFAATSRFRRMIERGTREVVERRSRPRMSAIGDTPSGSFRAFETGERPVPGTSTIGDGIVATDAGAAPAKSSDSSGGTEGEGSSGPSSPVPGS